MEDLNKPTLDQLIKTAFPQVNTLKYTFTEYSLNTTYSFKFDDLAHFIAFLKQNQNIGVQEIALLDNMLKDQNLKIDSFFFVNFFE